MSTMFITFIIYILCIFVNVNVVSQSCLGSWISEAAYPTFCYQQISASRTWNNATNACKSLNGSATLPILRSMDETFSFSRLMKQTGQFGNTFWLGIYWNSTLNKFLWVDGSNVTYLSMMPTYTLNVANGNASTTTSFGSMWMLTSTQYSYPTVCQLRMSIPPIITTNPIAAYSDSSCPSSDWYFDSAHSICYYYNVSNYGNYNESVAQCQTIRPGSTMPYFNSQYEFYKYTVFMDVANVGSWYCIWLGIIITNGIAKTVNNTNVVFPPVQGAVNTSNCVHETRQSVLNVSSWHAISCSGRNAFVCQCRQCGNVSSSTTTTTKKTTTTTKQTTTTTKQTTTITQKTTSTSLLTSTSSTTSTSTPVISSQTTSGATSSTLDSTSGITTTTLATTRGTISSTLATTSGTTSSTGATTSGSTSTTLGTTRGATTTRLATTSGTNSTTLATTTANVATTTKPTTFDPKTSNSMLTSILGTVSETNLTVIQQQTTVLENTSIKSTHVLMTTSQSILLDTNFSVTFNLSNLLTTPVDTLKTSVKPSILASTLLLTTAASTNLTTHMTQGMNLSTMEVTVGKTPTTSMPQSMNITTEKMLITTETAQPQVLLSSTEDNYSSKHISTTIVTLPKFSLTTADILTYTSFSITTKKLSSSQSETFLESSPFLLLGVTNSSIFITSTVAAHPVISTPTSEATKMFLKPSTTFVQDSNTSLFTTNKNLTYTLIPSELSSKISRMSLSNFNETSVSTAIQKDTTKVTKVTLPPILESVDVQPGEISSGSSLIATLTDISPFLLASLNDSVKSSLGYNLHDMITTCTFNDIPCDMENDFKAVYSPLMGNCYTYNAGKTPKSWSNRAGSSYGLKMLLAADQLDYSCTSSVAGFKVAIHENSVLPFPEAEGYYIPLGTVNAFGISSNRVIRDPAYSVCAGTLFGTFNGTYSTEACQRECFQTHLLKSCKCVDPRYPSISDASYCSAKQSIHLTLFYLFRIKSIILHSAENSDRVEEHFSENPNSSTRRAENALESCLDFYQQCESMLMDDAICNCPSPCNETLYKATLSMAKLRTKDLQGAYCNGTLINETFCDGDFRKNFAALHIYYQQIKVFELSEKPAYDISDLFNDFAGVTGVVMGVGIVTFVEIIFLFALCFFNCTRHVV